MTIAKLKETCEICGVPVTPHIEPFIGTAGHLNAQGHTICDFCYKLRPYERCVLFSDGSEMPRHKYPPERTVTNFMEKAESVDATLAERGKRYGEFKEHAKITQSLKYTMYQQPGWEKLSDDKKEALEMIAHKIGRILNGDPEYKDSWHDIGGYAKLAEDRCV